MSMPASIASDTGIDVLTHAIEAYVSILASDFTDGLAKQAVKLVFDYLERSVKNGKMILKHEKKCIMLERLQGWHLPTHSLE